MLSVGLNWSKGMHVPNIQSVVIASRRQVLIVWGPFESTNLYKVMSSKVSMAVTASHLPPVCAQPACAQQSCWEYVHRVAELDDLDYQMTALHHSKQGHQHELYGLEVC
jgi:hypothetical protein